MKYSNPREIALVLASILLVACGTTPPRGTPTNTYVGGETGKTEEYLGDRDLAKKFVLLNIKTEKVDGRLSRVQFDLKNTTSTDLAIEWSIEWKDGNGFRIDVNPHWRPAVVAGMGFQSILEAAPTPEAAVWQLHFRKPTPVR